MGLCIEKWYFHLAELHKTLKKPVVEMEAGGSLVQDLSQTKQTTKKQEYCAWKNL
jgi:hypothetical protein